MKTIYVKNTYNIDVEGKPSEHVDSIVFDGVYGVSPSRIKGIKPKLSVKEGVAVEVGSQLFFDKKDPGLQFLSPVSGVVEKIVYGERRVVNAVTIKSDSKNTKRLLFAPLSKQDIQNASVNDLCEKIQLGGLWSSFTSYPFQVFPKTTDRVSAIYVTLDDDEPFMPQAHVFLKGKEEVFLKGLAVLEGISPKVYVGLSRKSRIKDSKIRQYATHQLDGAYPANNPGVFLFYNKKGPEDNVAWGIKAHDVLRIGELFESGGYPNEKIITLAGSSVNNPSYKKITEGIPVNALLEPGLLSDDFRIICGGLLTGQRIYADGFVAHRDSSVHVIPEGRDQELLHFFKPGFDKPTFGNTYLSTLNKIQNFVMTSSLNGGHRACISCGVCPQVCPVQIYPQLLMKHLEDNDTETAMEQGLLDCVECGICTYVCPSKIELGEILSKGIVKIAKEVG